MSRLESVTQGQQLRLLVMGRTRMATYRLPSSGEVTIGSDAGCDVRIEEPSVEARHARLQIGRSSLRLVNMAASIPTAVGAVGLPTGVDALVSPGTIMTLGGVSLVIQSSGASTRLRHVRSHAYFEGRIEDECARVDQTGGSFVVARFAPRTGTAPQLIEDALAECLRVMDVVATYTPTEYEALLVDCGRAKACEVMDDVQERVRAVGGDVMLGWAHYPRDARTPEALFAAAAPAVDRVEDASEPVIHVSETEGMTSLRLIIERVAASPIGVLILGETGVGKEVTAKTLHALSSRATKPLVSINCAAVSESLLESELLGYERGAFTGAFQAKAGLLESASGGTIFLDEVGDMPLTMQAKLLRVIEQKEVTRLGSLTSRSIDVRFIAATNRPIEDDVQHGRFRRDLFYRLNGFVLVIPPLRERIDEIEPLAEAFATTAALEAGLSVPPQLSPQAVELLRTYAWPGNIRELKNVVQRAVLLCGGGPLIEPEHLPTERMGRTFTSLRPQPHAPTPRPDSVTPPPSSSPLSRPLRALASAETRAQDRERIVRALESCGGNQTKAAQSLGISRRTLIHRIEEYGLPRPKKG